MDTNPPCIPDTWSQALDESRADLAAGRTVDGQAMRQRLRDSIKRMEAKLEREPPDLPQP